MQQGLFVIPQNLSDESIYKRFETNTIKLIINEKIRDESLRYLDKLGYNEYRLMPDINSLCYEINKKFLNKVKWDENEKIFNDIKVVISLIQKLLCGF